MADTSKQTHTRTIHDRARKKTLAELIELNQTFFDMLYQANVRELKEAEGYVDMRLKENRKPKPAGTLNASDPTPASEDFEA